MSVEPNKQRIANSARWYTITDEGTQYNFQPNLDAVLDHDVARTFIHAASVDPNKPMPAGDYLPLANITGIYYQTRIIAGVRVDKSRLEGLVRVLKEKGWKQLVDATPTARDYKTDLV